MFANIGYLAIRMFSSAGHLALRSASFLDFMTTAVPLFLCVLALTTLANPINRKRDPRSFRKRKRNDSTDQKSSQGSHHSSSQLCLHAVAECLPLANLCAVLICGLAATISGIVAVYTIVDKLQNDDCPHHSSETQDDLLPTGLQCIEWQFNMFVSNPACSCKYLYVDVFGCDEEDYNVTSFEEYLSPLLDYVQDTQFLAVKYNPDCRSHDGAGANTAHSKFFASSLEDLQMVSLIGDLGFETLRQEGWSDMFDLVGIHLNAPYLQEIDSKVFDSWSKLQVFDCNLI